MNDYVILTDSSADLDQKMVADLGLEVLPLTFVLKGKNYKNWPDNREMSAKAFYRQLREGAVATTAGNAVAVPAVIAATDTSWAAYADIATSQVAASAILTAILVPIITSWWAKKFGCPQFPLEDKAKN